MISIVKINNVPTLFDARSIDPFDDETELKTWSIHHDGMIIIDATITAWMGLDETLTITR